MYYQYVLLLLTIFAAVATSQTTQACRDAGNALGANERCVNASFAVRDLVADDIAITTQELNTYCSPDCRVLTNRVLFECSDPDSSIRDVNINEFLCAHNGNESCFEVIRSPRYTAATAVVRSSNACRHEDGAQMCSPECVMQLQTLVNVGGCCVVELLEFASQLVDDDLMDIISICASSFPQVTPCEIIGSGANVLKAYGIHHLLFPVIITVTSLYSSY